MKNQATAMSACAYMPKATSSPLYVVCSRMLRQLRLLRSRSAPLLAVLSMTIGLPVTVAQSVPAFDSSSPTTLEFMHRIRGTLGLPFATGDDQPLTYALSPEGLPTGLSRSGISITGTPSVITPRRDYVWTVTDDNGDVAMVNITIEVLAQEISASFGLPTYIATEGGTDAEVTVSLNQIPRREVILDITETLMGVTTTDDYMLSSTRLTFVADALLSELRQTIMVTARDNLAVHGPGSKSVVLGFGALPDHVRTGTYGQTTVTLADDDTRGVSISKTSLTVTEAAGDGNTDTYTVVLTSKPVGGNVTVMLGNTDSFVATVSPAALTFTPTDWNMPQTVTVTAVDDDIVNTVARTATIIHDRKRCRLC